MYKWVLFFHVVGALVFMMSHGVSIFVAFRLQQEQNVDSIRALLDLSTMSLRGTWGSTFLLLAAGIALGFMGKWWSQGWLWFSIGIFVAVAVIMFVISSRAYYPLRTAVGLPDPWSKADELGEVATDEEIQTLIKAGHPQLMAIIGLGGLFIIRVLLQSKIGLFRRQFLLYR